MPRPALLDAMPIPADAIHDIGPKRGAHHSKVLDDGAPMLM
jgi:hypothetical protein